MSPPVLIALVIVGIGVVVGGVAIMRARSARDGVDSFRRQIDALSPEARRPVVDQVQNAAGRSHDNDRTDDVDDDEINEDGGRGT